MPLGRLKKYLDDNKIKYVIKSHSIAYTAAEIAALAHVPGKEWAKTVIIKIDDKLAMAVLPASIESILMILKKLSVLKISNWQRKKILKAILRIAKSVQCPHLEIFMKWMSMLQKALRRMRKLRLMLVLIKNYCK